MSLGMFDGVHKGHQEIIKKTKKSIVKPTNWKVHCSLFWPHPRKVLQPEVEIKIAQYSGGETTAFRTFRNSENIPSGVQ